MTMHKALHQWDNIDGLYLSRKRGGSGLTSISIRGLEDNIKKRKETLITLSPPS